MGSGMSLRLEAAFEEASLITGRMFLNIIGVSKNRRDELVHPRFEADDVTADDLGGQFVEIQGLTIEEVELLTGFLKMADKGAAHLTMPIPHPLNRDAYRHRQNR